MTVLITGANRGIGKALFDGYAAKGETVYGTHRAADEGQMLELDVTDPASHKRLAERLAGVAIDILICNAGVNLDKDETLDTGYPVDQWEQTFATNVTGVFLTIQHLLPHLRRVEAPKIAIIGSQLGSQTIASGGGYIYCASKAAVLNVGRNLAVDLKPEGFSVGIYHPGWVKTDMGGAEADLTLEESASGLIDRIAILGPQNTGCYETWEGHVHPY